MRIAQAPLTESETHELEQLLERSGAPSLYFARGVFAAASTAPTELEPTEWLPLVLGPDSDNRVDLKRALSLLMRECNACASCLELGQPAVPAPSEEEQVHQYSRGYMRVAGRDQAWKADTTSFSLSLPLMALSGYADLAQLLSIETKAPSEDDDSGVSPGSPEVLDEEELLTGFRENLVDTVAELYTHFAAARKKSAEVRRKSGGETVTNEGKVGRNDPCPCGSGRKSKKCCGA